MPRQEKQKKIAWYIAGFLAALMILSVFGIVISDTSPTQKYTYQDYSFSFNQQTFSYDTTLQGKKVSFNYLPQDFEKLEINREALQALNTVKVVAVTYDPQDINAQTLGGMQFALEQELYSIKKVIVQRGLTNAEGYSIEQITCANATTAIPVMTLQFAEQSGLRQEGNCFFLEGLSNNELTQYFDRIRYSLYGVMP